MIRKRDERQAIVDNNIGIVFLTSGEETVDSVVPAVLSKLESS